jgi:hypothetical protein
MVDQYLISLRSQSRRLIEGFLRQDISSSAFCDECITMWMDYRNNVDALNSKEPDVFFEILTRIHSSCSVYRETPENSWEIDGEQLYAEVQSFFLNYEDFELGDA